MQVSVEVTQGLKRRMTVGVPKAKIDQEVQQRLASLARTSRINGFRPGKVPVRVIQQKFGSRVREEVIRETVQSSFQEAVSQEKLRPAGFPEIEFLQGLENAQEDLSYAADFEVYPEISRVNLEGVVIERPSAEIGDADVDKMLDTLRKQAVRWERVDRPAQNEDRLTVDYTSTVDGQVFAEGSAKDQPVVLGSGRMLEGFEEGLVGAVAGATVELNLHFPEDYRRTELAGKPTHISVTVHGVEAPVLPELDADFAKGFGVDSGIDDFRREVRNNMQRELDKAIKSQVKQHVLDALLAANEIEVPQALVDNESQRLAHAMREDLRSQGLTQEHLDALELRPEAFAERARKRVVLGLLISELVKANQLQADADAVRQMVEELASSYEDPASVVKWFYSDRQRLGEVEANVLEEKVVAWILGQVTINDKAESFDQVMARQRAN
jgi:trigger factor